MSLTGILKSVDQYLNIKLEGVSVTQSSPAATYAAQQEANGKGDDGADAALLDPPLPHLSSVKNVFVRGSTVRYVRIPREAVDVALLEDATRREAQAVKEAATAQR